MNTTVLGRLRVLPYAPTQVVDYDENNIRVGAKR